VALPYTPYDAALDAASINPGKQLYLLFSLSSHTHSLFLSRFRPILLRTTTQQAALCLTCGYEKMLSGMYLGELTRLVLLDLSERVPHIYIYLSMSFHFVCASKLACACILLSDAC
jgi:hexokinase